MSTSADTRESARKPTPIYKRKRRRIYGSLAVAAIVVIAVIVWAVTRSGGSGAALPGFTIAYGQGTVANSDSIIDSDAALAKTIPAQLHFVPFDAGVTAIAEMRSGSLQAISGVGNPPVVGAIGTGTGVDVVIAQSFDADALIVPKSVTAASQLAGKSVGVLVGSSEDYELRGWLGLQHLTGSVKVVGFASEQAAAAAYLAGSVTAAYVQAGPEAQLTQKGGHPLVNAEQIAKLGIPGLNVVAVSQHLVRSDPALVQRYVCAEVQATRLFTGPQAAKYLTQSAKVQGVPGNLIVPATRSYPFIPLSQQLFWLGSGRSDTTSPIVKAYVQTGKFLVGQGRLTAAPSAAVVASHVDPTFVKKALAGGCSS
jgi:taurine transport system substrate-binding protein